MYRIKIYGWTVVEVFTDDIQKGIKTAIREKKKRCKDDLERWDEKSVSEYYGMTIDKIEEGTILIEG